MSDAAKVSGFSCFVTSESLISPSLFVCILGENAFDSNDGYYKKTR